MLAALSHIVAVGGSAQDLGGWQCARNRSGAGGDVVRGSGRDRSRRQSPRLDCPGPGELLGHQVLLPHLLPHPPATSPKSATARRSGSCQRPLLRLKLQLLALSHRPVRELSSRRHGFEFRWGHQHFLLLIPIFSPSLARNLPLLVPCFGALLRHDCRREPITGAGMGTNRSGSRSQGQNLTEIRRDYWKIAVNIPASQSPDRKRHVASATSTAGCVWPKQGAASSLAREIKGGSSRAPQAPWRSIWTPGSVAGARAWPPCRWADACSCAT